MNDERYQLILGDCLEVLKTLQSGSVDAVVTDPPAGIAFMGKEWDSFPNRPRGTLPGGNTPQQTPHKHQLGFARGVHWDSSKRDRFIAFLSAAMTEALRVIRPGGYALVWAIPRTSHWTATAMEDAGWEIRDRISHIFGQGFPKGKGCLKPAVEDWWLCRAPGKGVRPLGIEECRILCANHPGVHKSMSNGLHEGYRRPWRDNGPPEYKETPIGRWPANLVLSHHPECNGECHADCPIRLLDEQSGERGGGFATRSTSSRIYGGGNGFTKATGEDVGFGDTGGASRFFYVPKASRKDRGKDNNHPTVKNTALMEWLVKLVCPEGGICLDPFTGSGSTGVACLQTGRKFIGIECEPNYFAIAQKRLAEATAGLLPGVLNG